MRKIIYGVLILTIMAALIITPAYAEKGTLGRNLAWEYENGTLTITGTGKMNDFNERVSGWASISSEVETVVLNEGVTSIGDYAFANFTQIKKITIPATVKSIGKYAFWKCTQLEKVIMVEGLEKIETGAFDSCSNLVSVFIPASVTTINDHAFEECDSLSNVYYNGNDSQWRMIYIHKNTYEVLKKAKIYTTNKQEYVTLYSTDGTSVKVTVQEAEKLMEDDKWYYDPVQVLYDAKGNSEVFIKDDVEYQLSNGWYTEPVKLLYSPDGESYYVEESKIDSLLNEGWANEPIQMLYAADGRSQIFKKADVEAQLTVGWYKEPIHTVYSATGEEQKVERSKVRSMLNDGWYEEPVQTLYALDGRSEVFKKTDVPAQLTVGWYEQPVQMLYNLDGRSQVFKKIEVDSQIAVGWYEEPVQVLYALDGRNEVFKKADVPAQLTVGWYEEPMQRLYALDGRVQWFKQSEVAAQLTVGWYSEPVVTIYAPDYDFVFVKECTIFADELQAYKSVGWYDSYSEALYNLVKFKIDAELVNSDYRDAIAWSVEYKDDLEEPYRSLIREKEKLVLSRWRNASGCPLVVAYDYVTENSIGTPLVNVGFINCSSKTITAFKIKFNCYDAFNDPVYNYSGNNIFEGYDDDCWLYGYEAFDNFYLASGKMVWTLYVQDRTKYVKNVRVTEIMFSDGTKWKR